MALQVTSFGLRGCRDFGGGDLVEVSKSVSSSALSALRRAVGVGVEL